MKRLNTEAELSYGQHRPRLDEVTASLSNTVETGVYRTLRALLPPQILVESPAHAMVQPVVRTVGDT